jgi:MOSC domain-containing protein YiiM
VLGDALFHFHLCYLVETDYQMPYLMSRDSNQAVYAYPTEHYDYWRDELRDQDLPPGTFGENLTTEGLHENRVYIGDRFRIGTVELVVTQPRLPCFKLGIKFGTQDMVKRFLHSQRTGFYFAVAQEGVFRAGDQIELAARATDSLTVADILKLHAFDRDDREMLRRAVRLEALPESWRERFKERLRAVSPSA